MMENWQTVCPSGVFASDVWICSGGMYLALANQKNDWLQIGANKKSELQSTSGSTIGLCTVSTVADPGSRICGYVS